MDNIFLILSRLTDPPQQGKNENSSLSNLIKSIENTIKGASRLNLSARLDKLKEICENIKIHRDKRIGHTDINRALKVGTEWLPAVTYGAIEDALNLIREMMQDITVLLFDGSSGYDPDIAYGHGTDKLFYVLRKGHERIADEKKLHTAG